MLPRFPVEPGVNKIAVLRANALGDFILSLPALDALHAAYPGAEIVLLARHWHERFLNDRPGPVDRVVVVPAGAGIAATPDSENDPEVIERFFAAMRAERFDLAIQLHGGGSHSNPFVRRLGARVTVGMRAADAEDLDRTIPYVYFQHEILRHLEVVSLVGADATSLEPRLALISSDLEEAATFIPAGGVPIVAIHPGASDPRRRWPPEKFAAVAGELVRHGARVVVTGTEAERDVVRQVVEAMAGNALDLCGRLSLGGLAGLLSRCAVLVSNDTGPLHLACAVGTRTAGIFWCYNLVNVAPLTRVRHRPATSWQLTCPVCGVNCTRDSCPHDVSFVADVPIAEVQAHALALLADAVRPPPQP